MFQLRNLVNRRNIKKDPSYEVNASEAFFTTVVHGHIATRCCDGSIQNGFTGWSAM